MTENETKLDTSAEIQVLESDCRNLTFLDRSDIVFAILYGIFFVWGLVLTLFST